MQVILLDTMKTFDGISGKYREKALVQQKAAFKLLDLLNIGSSDNIIDIACGPGNITNTLRELTRGKVIGIDISEKMIKQARSLYSGIEFRVIAIEDLDHNNEFDIAFCNSALQWFTDPDRAMTRIFNSLKPEGKIGLACPATNDWAPCFDSIISKVSEEREIKPVFSHWKNPWFHLPGKNDYRLFFEKHGFVTMHIVIDHERTEYSQDEAFGIFLSGAANGYTSKEYYDIKIDEGIILQSDGGADIDVNLRYS
jgi:ubiquinone/menaquinone biosynthesis C-methylase UbiE